MAKKVASKNSVIIYHQESTAISIHPVLDENASMVEIDTGVLPLDDCQTYINGTKGGLIYAYNLDIPAKIESENIKALRRSVTLRNIFQFDRGGSFDFMKLMPWIIVALVIVFK